MATLTPGPKRSMTAWAMTWAALWRMSPSPSGLLAVTTSISQSERAAAERSRSSPPTRTARACFACFLLTSPFTISAKLAPAGQVIFLS